MKKVLFTLATIMTVSSVSFGVCLKNKANKASLANNDGNFYTQMKSQPKSTVSQNPSAVGVKK